MRLRTTVCLCAIGAILAGCGTKPIQPSDKHIQRQDSSPATSSIPQPITGSAPLPPPKPSPKADTYSVVVTNVSVQEILFALARDAKINLDIHPGIQGAVTLNALNQTLPQILTRIARQADMRYELDNGNLIVMPDTPYLHHYRIDYVNMARDTESSMITSAQVASATASGSSGGTNGSLISVKNTSKNHFWEILIQNIKDILRETDKEIVVGRRAAASTQQESAEAAAAEKPKAAPAQTGGSASGQGTAESDLRTYQTLLAASVIANPENGLITVRATGKQHKKIQEFIDQVMVSARRQVMIEATIVEVALSDNYKQGINWSALIKAGGKQFKLVQSTGSALAPLPTNVGNGVFGIITNPTADTVAQQVSLLESFGNVKVLSSPKISVLNNQTAVIKVVNNYVYFTITGGATTVTNGVTTTSASTSMPNTLPIGFTMSVTPQISDSDVVLLNLKPSISRLDKEIPDPVNAKNIIPQTKTRELESVMRVENNQIAVMGGLMQDEVNNLTDEIPGLAKVPALGELFKQRNDTTTKTELVIFLRPSVIKDASISGDFSAYRDMLPDQDFFKEADSGKP